MNRPLPIGLVGCGRAAERLWIPAILAVPEVRLAGVADTSAERRALLAGVVPCRAFGSVEEMVATSEVDAVIVATPPETHLGVARVAMNAGVPVLIEKPLAPTVSQAIELGALRNATGTPLMVGLNRRWWRPVQWLREQLARSNTGPSAAELVFVTQASRWLPIAGMSDLLDDLATHQLDLLRFLFDKEIDMISAVPGDSSEIGMRVKLVDGTTAACRISHNGSPAERIQVTTASGRRYRIDAKSNRVTPAEGPVREGLDLAGKVWRRLTRRRTSLLDSFQHQLRGFVAAVRNGTEPSPGVEDGIAAARAVAAARRSLAQGGVDVRAA